ncbi:MAG: DUF697 domain-containing protein [Wenzhouxiangellaceae bacterium]
MGGKGGDQHLMQAAESLRQLLDDNKIPASVRAELAEEYRQLEALSAKLTAGDLHIAVFGKVSAGKSSLLNALVGERRFEVSALHGETKHSRMTHWRDAEVGGVHLIDTPGINEFGGEERERMAHEVAGRCDLILFVSDGDLTETEVEALRLLAAEQRPLLLVLNKSDRYSMTERDELLSALRAKSRGLVRPENVVAAAADPRPETIIRLDAQGVEQRQERPRAADIAQLSERLWQILESEGKLLAALNASLFAGRMSDEVARRVARERRRLAEKITRTYCLSKGIAVAVNPIPVADLLAAATLDVVLVKQLSQVYGMPMSRRESGELLLTITAQLVALMGAVWGVNLVSSALKGISAGLSVALTAGAQGALAWYATYLVGRSAERYLIAGKSWGEGGPKKVVQTIVDDLDRASILAEAREEILKRLRFDKKNRV